MKPQPTAKNFLMVLILFANVAIACISFILMLQMRKLRARWEKQVREQMQRELGLQYRRRAQEQSIPEEGQQFNETMAEHSIRTFGSVNRQSSPNYLVQLTSIRGNEDLVTDAIIQLIRTALPHLSSVQCMEVLHFLREPLSAQHGIQITSVQADSRPGTNSELYAPPSSSATQTSARPSNHTSPQTNPVELENLHLDRRVELPGQETSIPPSFNHYLRSVSMSPTASLSSHDSLVELASLRSGIISNVSGESNAGVSRFRRRWRRSDNRS
ncbi:hypothetical protein C7974DRAFT_378454 [Boeremia exigua]|uniref:uncharacterized protein n=1 Tax=Boeremia exigua TaxID=749465 RepID=UPI001E8CBC4F|nr:uncharacterized protein C7974DRAFT_378454 [Boeremia exigua]KAH6620404.1 hypothetical protein C7974DRAFT_378454 [Boeremia exigua]